jgi:RHS repeat-associated protein
MDRFGDPAGLTNDVQWSWQVDSLGQILQSAEPDTATRSYSYSDWGEPIEARWVDGGIERRLVRSYDAVGRLTATEERNDGVTDPETVTTYAYDTAVSVSPLVTPTFVLGQLARATAAAGQVTFSYDAFGRKNTEVFTYNHGALYIQKTTYRADGRLAALEFNLPDQNYESELVKYTYDSAGRLRAMADVDASGGREIYRAEDIDPYGRVRKATMGGNIHFLADYATEGRRLIRSASVESPLGFRRMTFEQFDPVGRELSQDEINDGVGTNTQITYDALGRLRDVMKVDGGTTLPLWAYGYDPLGNLHVLRHFPDSKPDAWLSYHQAGDRDRVCRIGYGPGGLGGTACNVTYDGVGNTIEQATRTGVRRLEYFASGNVRRITEGAAQASFRYDPFGAVRELDVTGTGVSDTRRDRRYGGLIERRDQVVGGTTTTFISRSIPGPGGVLASRRGTKQDWIFGFGELRGNRFFANQDGAFVQEVKYHPFGEATSSGASPDTTDYTSYQWNGGDTLAAFTLSHLGARLYDPVIGRFLSRDPLTVFRTATTSNPYVFGANDPLNGADPSGLDCIGSKECLGEQTLPPWSGVIALATQFHALGPRSRTPPSAPEMAERIEKFKLAATVFDVPIPARFNLQTALRYNEDWVSLLDTISRHQESVEAYNASIDTSKARWRTAGVVLLAVAATGLAFGPELAVMADYAGTATGAAGLLRVSAGFEGLADFLGSRALGGSAVAGAAALGAREQIANGVLKLQKRRFPMCNALCQYFNRVCRTHSRKLWRPSGRTGL